MDTITHALLAALTVRVVAPERRVPMPPGDRQRMGAAALAGAFPDIDFVARWLADPLSYLSYWHRGITHSVLMLPLWAMLLGVVLAWLFRRRSAWRGFAWIAGIALLTHILGDLITTFGTQILAPFSTWRAELGTTFIIDPWFTAIVLGGVVAGLRRDAWTAPAFFLLTLLSYVGFQQAMKTEAAAIARAYALENRLHGATIKALPQPLSPFNWKLVIRHGDTYHQAFVSLADRTPAAGEPAGFLARLAAAYRDRAHLRWQRRPAFGDSATDALWVRLVWSRPELDDFRRFAMFPALYRIDDAGGETCVWFTDLRFHLPGRPPPFRYGLCGRSPGAGWAVRRLRGGH